MAAPLWRQQVEARLASLPLLASRFFVLATVDCDHRPHARYVVFRDWHDQRGMLTVSDARHSKVDHLRHAPWFEVCWYFGETREQFRLSGQATLVEASAECTSSGQLRQTIWSGLSASTRAQYVSPTPLAPLDLPALVAAQAPPADAPPPDNFVVVRLDVEEADHLQLGSPMQRTRHVLGEDGITWITTAVNP